MKKNLLYLCFALSFCSCSPKFFEGKILYQLQFIDTKGNDITARMKKDEGSEQHYFINTENYKSLNERGELTQLYNSSTNTYYLSVGMELQKVDAATPYPKTFEATSLAVHETILGYPCKALSVKSEIGATTYFYNKKIKIDSAPFSKHRFGNWNNYLAKVNGSLPLKFSVAHKEYTLIATAIEIQRQDLANDAFDVRRILGK